MDCQSLSGWVKWVIYYLDSSALLISPPLAMNKFGIKMCVGGVVCGKLVSTFFLGENLSKISHILHLIILNGRPENTYKENFPDFPIHSDSSFIRACCSLSLKFFTLHRNMHSNWSFEVMFRLAGYSNQKKRKDHFPFILRSSSKEIFGFLCDFQFWFSQLIVSSVCKCCVGWFILWPCD